MLHIEHHTIVLCVTYAGQTGEDLDDVRDRLARSVALSPGVVAVDGLTDVPLAELGRQVEVQLDAAAAETGEVGAAVRELRVEVQHLVTEAFRRGVSTTLTTLCDADSPASRQRTLVARVGTTLARAGHLAFIHREGIRMTPQLLVLGTELSGLLDVVAGLDVTSPEERARHHLAAIDELVEALRQPSA